LEEISSLNRFEILLRDYSLM